MSGAIVYVKHNCPGSWNDSDMSLGFYRMMLSDASDQTLGVCADTAFPVTGDMEKRIMTPLKTGDLGRNPEHLHDALTVMSANITSLRQGAEWGMGALDKSWPRLTMKLPFDPDLRAIRLEVLFLLYNFRVRTTGVNQIYTVFNTYITWS